MAVTRPLPLDAEELLRRIAGGEGLQLELKRGLPGAEKVARTLCAFANTRGGVLVLGVEDSGAVVGAPRPVESAAELARIASERVEPALDAPIGVVEVRGHRVVACAVGRAAERRAARLDGGGAEVSVRTGSRTRAASAAALRSVPGGPLDRPLGPLERDALAYAARAAGPVEPAAFAAAAAVSPRRAATLFARLERQGFVFGSGAPGDRRYATP